MLTETSIAPGTLYNYINARPFTLAYILFVSLGQFLAKRDLFQVRVNILETFNSAVDEL